LAVGVGTIAALQSPLLALETITVRGAQALSREAVIAAADLHPGASMLRLRPSTLRDRLLAHPRIAGAEVRLVWPRGLDVVVRERTSLCIIRCGDSWLEVAADAVVLAMHELQDGPGLGLFELEGVDPTSVSIGGRLPGAGSAAALEALGSILAEGETLTAASLASGNLSATLGDGTVLLLGPAGADLSSRTRVALGLLAEIRAAGRPVAYIDARLPGQPVIKPK
jgi:cell division protein FtsQ